MDQTSNKSPHSTTPERNPDTPAPSRAPHIAGIDVSHLSDEQHDGLMAAIKAIVSLLIGLVFRK